MHRAHLAMQNNSVIVDYVITSNTIVDVASRDADAAAHRGRRPPPLHPPPRPAPPPAARELDLIDRHVLSTDLAVFCSAFLVSSVAIISG